MKIVYYENESGDGKYPLFLINGNLSKEEIEKEVKSRVGDDYIEEEDYLCGHYFVRDLNELDIVEGKNMMESSIYKFQLEKIKNALRLTSNIMECEKGTSSFDRQVKQAYQYTLNALEGKKDIEVNYISGKNK